MEEPSRWKFSDPALLWLFPASYVLHFVEELATTAPVLVWTASLERPLPVASFAALSALALALISAGVMLAPRAGRFHWIVPALATAFLLNAAGHLAGSIAGSRYSAGLATAIIVWLPLSLLALVRVAAQSTAKTLWGGALVGAAIESAVVGLVTWLASVG